VANVNNEIQDELIKHQVYMQRLQTQQSNDIIETIDKTTRELTGAIVLSVGTMAKVQQVTAKQAQRLKTLEERVKKIRGKAITAAQGDYTDDLTGLVEHELEYADSLFRSVIPVTIDYNVPDAEAVSRRLINFGSYDGGKADDWFESLKGNDSRRIMQAITAGVTDGQTTDEIVRAVIGSRAFNYTDGVTNMTRNDAKRLVRTVTNGVANDARVAFYQSNSDIIAGVEWVSTLDGRTSDICISLDGKRWRLDEPHPTPPAHPNCRSTMTPIVDDEQLADSLGERPFVRDARTRRKRERDFRAEAKAKAGEAGWKGMTPKQRRAQIAKIRRQWAAENIGTVPARTTYPQWLRRQPKEFQDEVLGKTRAKLWRSGKFTLDKFVDSSGKTLTLEQLRKLEG